MCDSSFRTRSFPSPPDDVLRAVASAPRPTGGAAIATARGYCRGELSAIGFDVRETSFVFSALPGRLATPLFGAAGLLVAGVAGRLGMYGSRWAPAGILAGGAAMLWVAGTWLARRGVLRLPLLRETGVNVEAVPPGTVPAVWLCAHLDSKSQPIPTFVRTLGIAFMAAGYAWMLGTALWAASGGEPPRFHWVLAGFLTLVGSVPVVCSVVGARSVGALDNASGVATVLAAARELGASAGVGILISDAEELGLAGARAWSAARSTEVRYVLNCDGVDDRGGIAVMYTGRQPVQVLEAVAQASSQVGPRQEAMRMLPGLLADSVAFSDAGISSVTFMRGTLASLLRVHRPSDSLARLRGTGIAETASLVASTARLLVQGERN